MILLSSHLFPTIPPLYPPQLGYLTSYLLIGRPSAWRLIYGSAAPLAILMTAGMLSLPPSPRWLLLRAVRSGTARRGSLHDPLRGPLLGGEQGGEEGEERLHHPLIDEEAEKTGGSHLGSTDGSGRGRGRGSTSGGQSDRGGESGGMPSEAHELKQEAFRALFWLRGVSGKDGEGNGRGEREEEVRREMEEMVVAVESEEEKRRVEGEEGGGEKWSELVTGGNARALIVACGLVLFQQVMDASCHLHLASSHSWLLAYAVQHQYGSYCQLSSDGCCKGGCVAALVRFRTLIIVASTVVDAPFLL